MIPLTVAGGVAAVVAIVLVSLRVAEVKLPWRRVMQRPPRRRGTSRRRVGRRTRKRIRGLVAAGGLLLLVGAGVEAATLVEALVQVDRGSKDLADAMQTLGTSPGGWTTDRIAAASTVGAQARSELQSGTRTLSGDLVVRGLRHLPGIDDQLTAVIDLAGAAASGSDALGDLLMVAQSVVDSKTSAAAPGSRLLQVLASSSAPWTDAEARLGPPLDRLQGDLRRPLLAPLAGQVRRALDLLRPARDQARVGAIASRFGPAALGRDQPQTYLVLLPNPSEIRPAGGFSGTVGTLTMTGGAPSRIDVKNEELYTPLIKPVTPIPYPLTRYLKFNNNALELGDAGWDPDFPSTARLSEQMFAAATQQSVAGTISIDPYAIEAMLAVMGPVSVPGYGSFDAGNFFYKLNYIVNASTGPGSGKRALGPISRAVLQHVLTAPASEWPRLFVVFQHQADSRHLQGYFHDPALAAAATQVHYDGAVMDTSQDYLMVADGNVGANKGDYFVHKSMDVKAEVLAGPGLVRHQVSVRYQMPTAKDPIDAALNPGNGDYLDYVRIYLPANAIVADFKASSDDPTVQPGLDTISFEHNRQAVGAFIRLPRGHEVTLTLRYETPLTGVNYRLFVQKQAGVLQLPTTIAISYPGGLKTDQSALTSDLDLRAAW